MNFSIIIPWQDRGDPEFRRAAEFVIDHYRNLGIGEVVVGTYPYDGSVLNRSRLRNEGARLATGDVFLFVDAEILVPKEQLLEAARLAADSPGTVFPFSYAWTYLTPDQMQQVYDGAPFERFIVEDPGRSYLLSGRILRHWMVAPSCAITRAGYEAIGGWDEDFVGWGEEDRMFNWAAHWTLGPVRVVEGGFVHVNHTQEQEKTDNHEYFTEGTPGRRQYLANVDLFRRKAVQVHRPQIVVYTATDDPDADVAAWAESAADADAIYLSAPAGSATADRARAAGVRVVDAPSGRWRADHALDACLAVLPVDADLCFALHVDERVRPGWRDAATTAWLDGAEGFSVSWHWYDDVVMRQMRFHPRNGVGWRYPVFPAIRLLGSPSIFVTVPVIVVDRHEDPGRPDQFDPAAVDLMMEEFPEDWCAAYWAARYWHRSGSWDRARAAAAKVLSLSPSSEQSSDAALLLAEMAWDRDRESWLLRAAAESPSRREVWERLADHYLLHGMEDEAAGAAARCLRIELRHGVNDWSRSVVAWDDEGVRRRFLVPGRHRWSSIPV